MAPRFPTRPSARFVPALLLIAVSLLLASCVTSIYPLAPDGKGVVYRAGLTGTWKEVEGNTLIRVQEGGDSTYAITMIEVRAHDSASLKDTSYFNARLVEAEGYLLLDCTVALERQMDYQLLGDYTRAGLAPTHFIFYLTLKQNNTVAELAQLKAEDIVPLLKQKRVHYQADKNDQSIVLLEPSVSLRKFMVELIRERPSAWERSEWQKME